MKIMALTANKYQKEAWKTFMTEGMRDYLKSTGVDTEDMSFDDRDEFMSFMSLLYIVGKLNGESGEVAEEVFKSFRDGTGIKPRRDAAVDELGDVLWYVASACTVLGVTLEDLMEQNLGKVRAKYKKAQRERYENTKK